MWLERPDTGSPPSFADDRVHVPRHAHLTTRSHSLGARTVSLAMGAQAGVAPGIHSRPTSARPRARARPAVRPRDCCVFVGGKTRSLITSGSQAFRMFSTQPFHFVATLPPQKGGSSLTGLETLGVQKIGPHSLLADPASAT